MPTASIEILCSRSTDVTPISAKTLGVDLSYPPVSDRSPSIWQSHISSIDGTLVHIFDPNCIGKPRRWTYDVLIEEDWKRFRFKEACKSELFRILMQLIEESPDQCIWFYSDAQWSNKPKIFKRSYTLFSFVNYHDKSGIRFNSAIKITL